MAHRLNFKKDGSAAFFSVNQKAWHGLGTIITDYPNSTDALKFAGLDFTVEKRPILTPDPITGENAEIKTHFATLRTDTNQVLGVVGKDYQIVQNTDAFTFFDEIVGGEGIMYETAGALGNGERIFITAKLPGYIKVGQNDLIEQYLFLTTSHDGFGSITAAFTPVRIVCANTLNAALKSQSNAVKIRHTANAKDRLAQAHRLMGISNTLSGQLSEIFNNWAKIRITDPQLRELISQAMAPSKEVLKNLNAGKVEELSTQFKNTCEDVMKYALGSDTQQMDTTRGTVFGAYNAITGYFNNAKSYKTQEAKVKSMLFGGTAQIKAQSTFDLCSSFAKTGSIITLN